jgi:hypothetical protein
MIALLTLLLRIAGVGLLLLAILHVPIGRHLKWREDVARLSPINASIFHVHTLFICVVLVIMGLPCLLDPAVFLERTRAGAWLAWSFAGFWTIRLYCQHFVYRADLWRGKRMETFVHCWFTIVWTALALLFAACGLWQSGWLPKMAGP